MRLVYLSQCGASGTRLGAFLDALMRGFRPQQMVLAVGRMERNLAYLYKRKGKDERRRKWAIFHLKEIRALAKRSGLRTTVMATTACIETLQQRDYTTDRHADVRQHLENMAGQIRRLVTWEMVGLVYFEIPSDDVHYWEEKKPYTPVVYKQFPKAAWDIEQASKCIAVNRYTACVFHLMCAIDVAIQRLAMRFKVKVTLSMSWKIILDKLGTKIDQKYPSKLPQGRTPLTTRQRLKGARYKEVLLLLDRVREAWRNDTMHSRRQYDDQEAIEIFEAVGTFMNRVARIL